MIILLDIDGVLVTTPAWKVTEQLSDGFLKFNEAAAANLARIVDVTKATIVLTTTHRIHYTVDEWKELLLTRGIKPSSIFKVNEVDILADIAERATEIQEWVEKHDCTTNYVIIDDDLSLNNLPQDIKNKWVQTKPMIGLDKQATERVLRILLTN